MDLTSTETGELRAGVFVLVDEYTGELLIVRPFVSPARSAAIYALGKAVNKVYGTYDKDVCRRTGSELRHDRGSQFTSRRFQEELGFLGVEPSPAYVTEPETNGCAERMVKNLKEQVMSLKTFRSLEELDQGL